jgi:hypothetical protein
VAAAETFPRLVEDALVFAHRAIEEHEVLQKILQTEPERLLPRLTLEGDRLRQFVAAFLISHIPPEELRPGVTPADAADYVARMLLSFINGPGSWDLTDREQVRQLVRTEVLGGLLV